MVRQMGIYDRDHRQNDPWKKNQQSNESYKYNESKAEMEIDDAREFNQSASARRKLKQFKQTWKLDKEEKPKYFLSLFFWGLALLMILAISKTYQKHRSSTDSLSKDTTTLSNNSFDSSKELTPPITSVLSATYSSESANCPFTIIADNKNNYYVQLCDVMRGDKVIAKFFIRAGEELTANVPAGNYRIKFGSGSEWYGEKDLFGEFSRYGASEAITFQNYGYSSEGHTISFNNTVNGNFHTNDVSKDDLLKN